MMHYLLSVYNSYEQKFSSREFRGIFELEKVCITQNKKASPTFLTECFEKHFAKKTWFHLASQKRNCFPPLLNKPIGFITKLLEKQFKDSP